MTNGSRAFYTATDKIKTYLQGVDSVNTVTYGDIREVDLTKQTIFPLAHVMVDNVQLQSGTMTFTITVLAMDIVHVNKDPNIKDLRVPVGSIIEDLDGVNNTYMGIDNEQDVLNTMLGVVNMLNQSLMRNSLRDDLFELTGQGTCEPFTDRFENKLAGWAYTFSAFVKNDINICENI